MTEKERRIWIIVYEVERYMGQHHISLDEVLEAITIIYLKNEGKYEKLKENKETC